LLAGDAASKPRSRRTRTDTRPSERVAFFFAPRWRYNVAIGTTAVCCNHRGQADPAGGCCGPQDAGIGADDDQDARATRRPGGPRGDCGLGGGAIGSSWQMRRAVSLRQWAVRRLSSFVRSRGRTDYVCEGRAGGWKRHGGPIREDPRPAG